MTPRALWAITFSPVGMLLVLILAGGTWQFVSLAQEHQKLAVELETLRIANGAIVEPVADSSNEAELARTQREIASESARLEKAVAALKSAEKDLPPMTGEELRTLGRMEEFASKAAGLILQITEFVRVSKDPSAPGRDEAMSRAAQGLGKWAGWLEVVGQMEDNPTEIGELHARTIAERLSLDAATTTAIQERIATEFEQLGASGLVRSQRPSSIEETKAWNQRRSEALHTSAARIEELIPPTQKQPWVVEQSLDLGNSLRQDFNLGADGHGSAVVALVLPGMTM